MQYEKEFAYDQHIHHVQFMLRFIDFNFFTRVENILDETDHESKARSILVGFFWNFLD